MECGNCIRGLKGGEVCPECKGTTFVQPVEEVVKKSKK